jgi:hypothetical protein
MMLRLKSSCEEGGWELVVAYIRYAGNDQKKHLEVINQHENIR